jgi:hypothetical protein
MMTTLCIVTLEIAYALWGLFFGMCIPFATYVAPANSFLGKTAFFVSVYSLTIGIFYIMSVYFMAKRKYAGVKLALLTNILGIPFLMPIALGVFSFYFFTRPQVKSQFK